MLDSYYDLPGQISVYMTNRIYNQISFNTSKLVTQSYSTSFSFAASLLDKDHRDAIYAIYGFVRFADEIVDTFHDFPKESLLDNFESDLMNSLETGISLNPVLHAFQMTVRKYKIPQKYIKDFLTSMRADLVKKDYESKQEADDYIYGSAEVVGLMCLYVFTDGDVQKYNALKSPAMKLGSTFQKVNFLRDLKNDTEILGRTYFSEMNGAGFNETTKKAIIRAVELEFEEAYMGIQQLPEKTKLAVLTAYYYYRLLLLKIKNTPAEKIMHRRIRISNFTKLMLLVRAKVVCQFNLI
jgi:15-cis-phytoene synthase